MSEQRAGQLWKFKIGSADATNNNEGLLLLIDNNGHDDIVDKNREREFIWLNASIRSAIGTSVIFSQTFIKNHLELVNNN